MRKKIWFSSMVIFFIVQLVQLFVPSPFLHLITLLCVFGLLDWIWCRSKQISTTIDHWIKKDFPQWEGPSVHISELHALFESFTKKDSRQWNVSIDENCEHLSFHGLPLLRLLIEQQRLISKDHNLYLEVHKMIPDSIHFELSSRPEHDLESTLRMCYQTPAIKTPHPQQIKQQKRTKELEIIHGTVWVIGQDPDIIFSVQHSLMKENILCISLNDESDISTLSQPDIVLIDVDDQAQIQQVLSLLTMLGLDEFVLKLLMVHPSSLIAAERMISVGLDGIIIKPITEKDLVSMIKMHLEMAYEQRQKDEKFKHEFNQIRNLLDHAENGYLSFGSNLIVHDSHSAACNRIFKKPIAKEHFINLIAQEESHEARLLHEILTEIMESKDSVKRAIMIDLLPKRVNNETYLFEMDFHEILNEQKEIMHMMVIVKDLHKETALQTALLNERKRLQFIVNSMTNHNQFIDLIEKYKRFCLEELNDIFYIGVSPKTAYKQFFQSIHTFKGAFSQMQFVKLPIQLHELETEIEKMMEQPLLNLEFFTQKLKKCNILGWLDDELQVISETLGESFLTKPKSIQIDPEKIKHVERLLHTILPARQSVPLHQELKKMYYRPFKQLLEPYSELLTDIAHRLDKSVLPLRFEGNDMLVDQEHFYDFSRILLHVFKNSVDHGIESFEDRVSNYKEPRGEIRCTFHCDHQFLRFRIEDDGKGISPIRMKRKAVEIGLLSIEESTVINDEKIIQFIFHPMFTTKTTVSEISGRGIGLSAVKDMVEKFRGNIKVESIFGKSTTFCIEIPYPEGIVIESQLFSTS